MLRLLIGLALAAAAAAQPDVVAGKRIFESQCALCHGQSGGGGRGPSLARPRLDRAPDDAALRGVISKGIEPEMPGAWQLNPHDLENVAAFVRSLGSIPPEPISGNASRGARVYASGGCAGCHMIAGKGEGFGPELTDIGARRAARWLRRTVLDPSSSLPGGRYLSVTLASGESVRGVRINEDTFTIQVKDFHSNFHSYRKSEIKELRRLDKESPMPPYSGRLSESDLDDLVAYLVSLKGKV